jgi:hypothetical protein
MRWDSRTTWYKEYREIFIGPQKPSKRNITCLLYSRYPFIDIISLERKREIMNKVFDNDSLQRKMCIQREWTPLLEQGTLIAVTHQ